MKYLFLFSHCNRITTIGEGVNQAKRLKLFSASQGHITNCKLESVLYGGVCGCMCGGLIWTFLLSAELSMPDSNWVPSHRLNKATGEEKSITPK